MTKYISCLDVVHDEGYPAPEAEHPVPDHGCAVEGAGQGLHPVQHGFVPRHGINVKDPEVGKPAAGHTAVDDQLRVVPVFVHVGHGRMGFSGRGCLNKGEQTELNVLSCKSKAYICNI